MSHAAFLVDTSALARMLRDANARKHWTHQVEAGLIAVCPVIELELLYSARSPADRSELVELLRTTYGWVPVPDRAFDRAFEVQGVLTARGTHRSAGAADLLVAATAEVHGLVLLHYDRDFEQVAKATAQPLQWLAKPGTLK